MLIFSRTVGGRRLSSFGENHSTVAQLAEIKFIDEHIDYSRLVSVCDVIIQALRPQRALISMPAMDEGPYGLPRYDCRRQNNKNTGQGFTQPGPVEDAGERQPVAPTVQIGS